MHSAGPQNIMPSSNAVQVQDSKALMLPIHKLLSRIRWDPRFRIGRFALGYYDRMARRVVLVPFETIRFPADAPRCFEIWDEEGNLHRIPFHTRAACVPQRAHHLGASPAERSPDGFTGYE